MIIVSSLRQSTLACSLALLAFGPSGVAHASLVDPGFETGPLLPIASVVNPPLLTPGFWGEFAAVIAPTVVGGVTAYQGSHMLQVGPFAGFSLLIGAGQVVNVAASQGAPISFGAYFDTDKIIGALAFVTLEFFDSLGVAVGGLSANGMVVNSNPLDWQLLTVSTTIPMTAHFAAARVLYDGSSLQHGAFAGSGFVDQAELNIGVIPEPASLALAGLGCVAAGAFGRRRKPTST